MEASRWGKPYKQCEDGGAINEDTVLRLDIALEEDARNRFQAVCFDANVGETDRNYRCFVVCPTQGKVYHWPQFETTSHYIPLGNRIQYVAVALL